MATDLVKTLSDPSILHDSGRLLVLLPRVSDMLDQGSLQTDQVISPLVRLVATNNAQVKAAVCDVIVRAAVVQPDLGLLMVNTLTRDLTDPNPLVRSTAISTICVLPVLNNHAVSAIQTGLRDSNPTVRKSAVTASGKLFRHSPEVAIQGIYNNQRNRMSF